MKTFKFQDAETMFEKDFPKWDEKLIKCPPGQLYSDKKMKVYDRARDMEKKYGNRPSQ